MGQEVQGYDQVIAHWEGNYAAFPDITAKIIAFNTQRSGEIWVETAWNATNFQMQGVVKFYIDRAGKLTDGWLYVAPVAKDFGQSARPVR